MAKPRRPLLTMRSASGSTNWQKVWNEKVDAIAQHFNFFGGIYAEESCYEILIKAEDNISSKSGHLKKSGYVSLIENSTSSLVGHRVYFDTTKKAKEGANEKEQAFNYAFKVHEDGSSSNHWFLKNAYDSLRTKCLNDISKGLNINGKK